MQRYTYTRKPDNGLTILKEGQPMDDDAILTELRAADLMRSTLQRLDRIRVECYHRLQDADASQAESIVAETMVDVFDVMAVSRHHVEPDDTQEHGE